MTSLVKRQCSTIQKVHVQVEVRCGVAGSFLPTTPHENLVSWHVPRLQASQILLNSVSLQHFQAFSNFVDYEVDKLII